MSLVEIGREGEVAVLRLNRPEKLNAISSEVERALHDALDSEDVRTSGALVVAGNGRAFSAGADISEFEGRSPEDVLRYYRETGGVYEELAALPQPTIAAVHGYCLGGALELAVALDFRIADESAVFGFPEVSLGILASSGGASPSHAAAGAGPREGAVPAGGAVRRRRGTSRGNRHRGRRGGKGATSEHSRSPFASPPCRATPWPSRSRPSTRRASRRVRPRS